MTKMFTLLIALGIIFSCATCYAASKPVYDGDEKIFLEDFNAMAKGMTIDIIDTKIKTLPEGTKELSGKNLKINLILNQSGSIDKIWLSSTNKDRLAEGLIVTLATIGLSAEEFDKIFETAKENQMSVWCKFSKRKIIVERFVEGNNIGVLIEAEA